MSGNLIDGYRKTSPEHNSVNQTSSYFEETCKLLPEKGVPIPFEIKVRVPNHTALLSLRESELKPTVRFDQYFEPRAN